MRRASLSGFALLLALLAPGLLAAPGALAQKGGDAKGDPDRLTPRAAPTAVLPKLTPAAPMGAPPPGRNAPQARAPLLPLPVIAPPLSPVLVPGPGSGPATAPAPAPMPAPAPVPAPKAETAEPAVAAAPRPLRKPERAAEEPAVEKAVPEKPVPEKFVSEKPVLEKQGRRTVWAKTEVYVRATPDRRGRVVDGLEYGDRLEIAGDAPEGWLRVGRGGKPLGYVSAGYVTDKPPGSGAPAAGTYAKASGEDRGCALPDDIPESRRPNLAAGTAARVLADANLRVAPACDAKVRDVLEEGETVTVMGASGGWYQVGRRGRPIGYVGAALLAKR